MLISYLWYFTNAFEHFNCLFSFVVSVVLVTLPYTYHVLSVFRISRIPIIIQNCLHMLPVPGVNISICVRAYFPRNVQCTREVRFLKLLDEWMGGDTET
jgi:hypothetical protein